MTNRDKAAKRRLFQDFSIKRKLILITLLTTVIGLLISSIFLMAEHTLSFRQSMVKNLTVQAKIIGNNSTAALVFNNQKDAEEILSALKATPNILYAIIYSADEKVFASYGRDDAQGKFSPPMPEGEGHRFGVSHLSLFQPIILDDKPVGTVYIRSDLNELYSHIKWYLGMVGVALLISFSCAFLIITRLHHAVTGPILDLMKITQVVSRDKNYTLRTPVKSRDEIGFLSESFNEMLAQIQMRDIELEKHQEDLEALVGKRTVELENLTRQLQQELVERKRTEERLERSLSILRATLESTADGILVVDNERKIVSFNQKFVEMWHIPEYVMASRDDSETLEFILNQLKDPESFLSGVKDLYNKPDAEGYDFIEFKDGRIFERYSQPQEIAGKSAGRIWSYRDITDRKQSEEKIAYIAYHDILTGLPNRYLFKERSEQALASAKRYTRVLAVLFLDLDYFKRINDTFGHDMGDEVLQNFADRLTKCLRKSDTVARLDKDESESTIARLGGDEFIILLTEIRYMQDAAKVAQRILDLFNQPFSIREHEVFLSASIGISLHPDDGDDTETLLKNADTAMYYAKDHGRNNFQFYTASMNAAALERFALESRLRKALENNEFQLYYQPQLDIAEGKILGVEALIRWMHPDRGLISPASFIPLAEETGLIVPLGAWVLTTACKQNRAWQAAGFTPMRVTVNISGVQFKQKAFSEMVAQVLIDTDLEPQYLELELTESILMETKETSIFTLNELRATGVQISIDDFGTGYSSLGYLKRLPIDKVKIDRSFVRDIVTDPDDKAIINAIIAMAHNLDLKVVAEGVETVQQLSFLRESGTDMMQGYLFSPAVPPESIAQFLREEKRLNG